jgi:hypothetical protein
VKKQKKLFCKVSLSDGVYILPFVSCHFATVQKGDKVIVQWNDITCIQGSFIQWEVKQ